VDRASHRNAQEVGAGRKKRGLDRRGARRAFAQRGDRKGESDRDQVKRRDVRGAHRARTALGMATAAGDSVGKGGFPRKKPCCGDPTRKETGPHWGGPLPGAAAAGEDALGWGGFPRKKPRCGHLPRNETAKSKDFRHGRGGGDAADRVHGNRRGRVPMAARRSDTRGLRLLRSSGRQGPRLLRRPLPVGLPVALRGPRIDFGGGRPEKSAR